MDTPGNGQLSLFSGRGILSESQGPVRLIGTAGMYECSVSSESTRLKMCPAEHHALYQYHVVNAANHYMGLIQTETVCLIFRF